MSAARVGVASGQRICSVGLPSGMIAYFLDPRGES